MNYLHSTYYLKSIKSENDIILPYERDKLLPHMAWYSALAVLILSWPSWKRNLSYKEQNILSFFFSLATR